MPRAVSVPGYPPPKPRCGCATSFAARSRRTSDWCANESSAPPRIALAPKVRTPTTLVWSRGCGCASEQRAPPRRGPYEWRSRRRSLRGILAQLVVQLRKLVVLARYRRELLSEVLAVLTAPLRCRAATSRVELTHFLMAPGVVPRLLRFHPVVSGYRLMLLRRVGHLDDEMLDVMLLRLRNRGSCKERG